MAASHRQCSKLEPPEMPGGLVCTTDTALLHRTFLEASISEWDLVLA